MICVYDFAAQNYNKKSEIVSLRPIIFNFFAVICAKCNVRFAIRRALARKVETDADAVVLLGEFAHLVERGVSADGGDGLECGEQFLAFEEHRDTLGVAVCVAFDVEQERLQLQALVRGIERIGAAQCVTVDLARESAVFRKLEVGVGGCDAQFLIGLCQFFLGARGCHVTAGLGQQTFRGESASRLVVFPTAHEVGLREFVVADDVVDNVADGVGIGGGAEDGAEHAASR